MDAADLDDGSDGNDPSSAPSEFLAEFLSAIMQRQYAEALKYCRLILQYEPHNATARGFYPLLQHKVAAQHEDAAAAISAPHSDEARRGRGSCSPDAEPGRPARARRRAARPAGPARPARPAPETMEQEADEDESEWSRAGSRSRSGSRSAADDSCASQSSLEPDSSASAGRSDSGSGSGGGWESGGTAASGSGSGALPDDNGNALPASPSPSPTVAGGLHSDDMENDNDRIASAHFKSDLSAATLRRLRAQFACSIK